MKITNHDVVMSAQSQLFKSEKTQLKVEIVKAEPARQNAVELVLSQEKPVDPSAETEELFHLSEQDIAKIRLLEKLIAALTGKPFKFNQVLKQEKDVMTRAGQSVSFPQGSPAVMGLRIEGSHEIFESESMTFASKGVVKTADGRSIDFSLELHMSRVFYEKTSFAMAFGEQLQDPLVIDLDGKGIAFGNDTSHLDLTLNGSEEGFRMLAYGSGFLALDRNNNGIIDDGSELFGPRTGRGFSELAQFDEDANHWIDENDAIFESLKVWTVTQSGEKALIGLKEAGVGAIYLGSVQGQYHIKEGSQLLGRIRENGVYLKENGAALGIHEIDLKV